MKKISNTNLKTYTLFSTAVLVFIVLTAYTTSKMHQKMDELTVKRINVIEDDGTIRMVLSNKSRQHPGRMDGEDSEPRERHAGMIFFNDEGDESGGLIYGVSEEDGEINSGLSLTFDQYKTVVNNYGQNITVEFSSSSGTFIPSHISIPPGQAYDFINNPPLQFIADTNFNGTLNMNVQVTMGLHGIVCNEIHTYSLRHLMRPAPSEQLINFKAYPNPVKAHTQVAYELELEDQAFEGGELRLYSIAGNLLESRGLKRAQGVEEFNLSHLAPGKYILVFLHKGKRINQQVLIKE